MSKETGKDKEPERSRAGEPGAGERRAGPAHESQGRAGGISLEKRDFAPADASGAAGTEGLESEGARGFRRGFLLVLVAGISLIFLLVVRSFLLAVLLAAIFAGMAHPLFRWLAAKLKGRRVLAAIATMLILLLGVGLPVSGLLVLVVNEAVQVSQGADVWLRSQGMRLEQLRLLVERIPFMHMLLPDGEGLVAQFGELAERLGPALLGKLAAATRGTLNFALQFFILLYSFYFFLVDGEKILRKILYYIPLSSREENQLLERFVSVTRATLKGSLLIGLIQGGAAGLAFWIAGVPGAAFWGTVMVVLSVIPAVGPALVWVPAVGYLFFAGKILPAILLLAWCAVVVSSLDNLLRPRLIGRDARMSDLMILLSTLGGIIVFGVVGFIIGPVVAALFITVWQIYGEALRDWLPGVRLPGEAAAAAGRCRGSGEEGA